MKHVVVLGNGIAGLTAAETLRDAGFDGELTIVGEEPRAAYSRPALSKAALLDDDPAALRLPEATHGATELFGVRAEALDLDRHLVRLSNRETLSFDGVILATGSRARRLAAGRADAPEELTLRTVEDMMRLRGQLRHGRAVVVIGGGPLGMEIASGALDAGCAVTLVELGRPLARHLGPFMSDLLIGAALERGLQLRTSGVVELRRPDGQPEVLLGDGQVISADLVVTAVGDVPNQEWLSTSGALTNGHLVVDSRGRVVVGGRPHPNVVAAGDVATFRTASGMRRVPLWTSAIDQARVAGAALLLGEEAPALTFRQYFWTEQFGVNLRASGDTPVAGPPEVVDGDLAQRSALLRWTDPSDAGTAVAVNYKIPIPRLRRLAQPIAAA